jgi:Fe-S cluster assembly protein SufD
VVLQNGRLHTPAPGQQLPPFLKVLPLAEAKQEQAFQEYFGRVVDVDQYHFAALNTALFTDGLFIEIAPNAHLDKPLHIVHAFTGQSNLFLQPRHLVVAHRSASLTVIESVVSDDSDAKILVNSLTEVVLEQNARLTQYTVQRAKKGLRHLQQTEVCQKRDSVYTNYTFSLPAAELLRNNLHVHLDEGHTESHLYGLYLTADRQLVDNHTFMNHLMPHCESNEIYKGVLLDNSVGVFNGKVYVRKDAQKTNAFQQNNNLLLSQKATINSKPQLEIFADDVKCSHGSTTGQLNPEALFYLKTRGISDQTAKAMLVNAFAFDVTEKIEIPELEAYINHLIDQFVPADQEAMV